MTKAFKVSVLRIFLLIVLFNLHIEASENQGLYDEYVTSEQYSSV